MTSFQIKGIYVDIFQKRQFPAEISIAAGKIQRITEIPDTADGITHLPYILPGFIDAHVHIESSMLIPSEFARLAVVHGTVGTVSDPHEIANVCGLEGVHFMIDNGKQVPFKFNFGAPSCVPATVFETAGATLDAADVTQLLNDPSIKYLSEMMNFPGVIHQDPQVLQKIGAALERGKPVDGHAPGLRGANLQRYITGGIATSQQVRISTDHECFTKEEAAEKLSLGMKIIIREGSAAKNFEALIELMHEHATHMMFCSDDKHPDSLEQGHINQLCKRAVAKGIDVYKVLQAACINPVEHYKLDIGLLREGEPADFILSKDLINFEIIATYINGQQVSDHATTLIPSVSCKPLNQFQISQCTPADLRIEARDLAMIPVIEALDGQLITHRIDMPPTIHDNSFVSDIDRDLLKIVVVNRYKKAPIAKSFIKNIGLKKGAIASSVAHDSHNIVAVGADDDSLSKAINLIMQEQGGVSCVKDAQEYKVLGLPVAGLMSMEDGYKVSAAYTEIDAMAKSLGSTLSAPYMTLSFMALLVIPHIKLSDMGLFDGDQFAFIP